MKHCWILVLGWLTSLSVLAETVTIGLNAPSTGRYKVQGIAQARGALLAIDEINKSGGILGNEVLLARKNTASDPKRAVKNVRNLVLKDGAAMLLGGVSSSVAIAAGKEAKSLDRIYFGTLTYSNTTTGAQGHTHMFRETYNAWMGAKVLAKYLNKQYAGKKFFFITADYTWGWSTEGSLRQFTNTQDTEQHQGVKTTFPKPRRSDFSNALDQAKASGAEVLVVVQFGDDMVRALKMIRSKKLDIPIVVPSLTLGMAQEAGAVLMDGVVGAVPWAWQVPYQYGHGRGQKFVQDFLTTYDIYPSSSAASAYSIVYQYKDAVERAKSFDTKKVIKALEGHRYSLLKDEQEWRGFDHQNIQSVYVVRGKPKNQVVKDRYRSDYFEILDKLDGAEAVRTYDEWLKARQKVGKGELK